MTVKSLGLLATALFSIAGQGIAQTAGKSRSGASPGSDEKTCVQVQIAGQNPGLFGCLNQELQSQALSTSEQPLVTPVLGAGSPPNTSGTFNETGLAQQYGKNFGVSAVPYRPPTPVFNSSMH